MSNIQVGGALLPGSVDTPLDARSRIAALENIPDIPNPFIGMTFYVTATGKQYIVKSLKSKQIGAATVANAAIDQYEIAGGADTDQLDARYAAKDHDHNNAYAAKAHNHDAEYAAKTHGHAVADVTGLQTALDGKAAAEHNHDADYAPKQETADALDGKAAADHNHDGTYAPLIEEKIPEQYLPSNVGAVPATLSLPVPYDANNDNVSLVVDICENQEFEVGTYNRITMSVWYAKMKVFSNERFWPVPGQSLGVPYYGSTVSFTLDQEMFPGYVPGKTYYARYSWVDSNTNSASSGWKGFRFTGDIADMEPIHTDFEPAPNVKATAEAKGILSLDYLAGEIQNYTMTEDVTIRLSAVANVPFGAALLVNVTRSGGTLTVIGGATQTYDEDKTYMIVISNFGTLQVAVTETV